MAPSAFGGIHWIDGQSSSCLKACYQSGYSPVVSGTHSNGQDFYVCRSKERDHGNRPGWNLDPWNGTCSVSVGTSSHADVSNYDCLCTD